MTPAEAQAAKAALLEALTSGVLTVEYADRKVTYRSFYEMKQALGLLENLVQPRSGLRRGRIITSRGFD